MTSIKRFGGSLNLNIHFHVVVLDGVFTRDADRRVTFRAASPPTIAELETIVHRVRDRALGWLRRRGFVDERPAEERSDQAPELAAALDACAAIAMQRGTQATTWGASACAVTARDRHSRWSAFGDCRRAASPTA